VAVDEDLDCVAGSRGSVADRPPPRWWLERVTMADPLQASLVVAADLLGDLLAEPGLDWKEGSLDRAQRGGGRAQIRR
jgi:hypothetical protein